MKVACKWESKGGFYWVRAVKTKIKKCNKRKAKRGKGWGIFEEESWGTDRFISSSKKGTT